MNVLLGLAFIGGGIYAPVYYARCLRAGEFPGGRRRSYQPITRTHEPVRFWMCATMFGASTVACTLMGVGIGLAAIFAVR